MDDASRPPGPVEVRLLETGEVQVDPPQVTCRRSYARKHRIFWVRGNRSEWFKFVGHDFPEPPIDSNGVVLRDNYISAINDTESGERNRNYYYDIEIEAETGARLWLQKARPDGKGVIRNED